MSRALARLERKGLAIYTGFTPTDAAHVLGASDHWSRPAAVLAARIWARQMRHLYGMGKWANGDEIGPSQFALDKLVEATCQKLIETGLNEFGRLSDAAAVKTAALMTQIALHTAAIAKRSALGTASPVILIAVTLHQTTSNHVCQTIRYATPNEVACALDCGLNL